MEQGKNPLDLGIRLAVLLIALSCELDDFYAVVYTKENVAAKALADQISDLPRQRSRPLDVC